MNRYDVKYFDEGHTEDEHDGKRDGPSESVEQGKSEGGEQGGSSAALLPGPGTESEYIHTNWNVLVTSYGWKRGGRNVRWARRVPHYGQGLIDRGAPAYGKEVVKWCNDFGIHAISGYYEPRAPENPLPNFRSALWPQALGSVKLCHMFSADAYPAKRDALVTEVSRWGADMQNDKYARIRVESNTPRPLLLMWGPGWSQNPVDFGKMLTTMRNAIRPLAGEPFVVATEHIVDKVDGNTAIRDLFVAHVDGVYNHGCALPWKINEEWSALLSSQRLGTMLAAQRQVCSRYGKVFFSGTMPTFDRDLYGAEFEHTPLAPQGRVVAKGVDQITAQLTAARRFAPISYSEIREEANGLHVYQDAWVILTSLNEWEEGTTLEPSLVRGSAYQVPNYDSGFDGFSAIKTVYRDTVVRRRVPATPQ